MLIKLFMTCVICQCVYSTLGDYSLSTRWAPSPLTLCSFGPLGTDAIDVPGVVRDVPLHKRFPSWCWPVISFLVINIMSRHHVPHNMLYRKGPKVSRVYTRDTHTAHPHNQAAMFFNTQSCFHWWCEWKNLHQVLLEYFKCKDILNGDTSTWLQRKTTMQHQKSKRLNMWIKQLVKKAQILPLPSATPITS